MKRLLLVVCAAALLSGCATAHMPVSGFLYGNVKGPMAATGVSENTTKVGRASARSILGIIASGDASIHAAARNGGIREIHYVDYESQTFFGVLAEFTVVVYGN